MKDFTFSFYIKSSNVSSPKEGFPPPNPRGSLLSLPCTPSLCYVFVDVSVCVSPNLGTL